MFLVELGKKRGKAYILYMYNTYVSYSYSRCCANGRAEDLTLIPPSESVYGSQFFIAKLIQVDKFE